MNDAYIAALCPDCEEAQSVCSDWVKLAKGKRDLPRVECPNCHYMGTMKLIKLVRDKEWEDA